MKKYLAFLFIILIPVLLTSCVHDYNADIVVTLFPHYDIAKQIAGNNLKVTIVTPFGSEAHDFEPSPKQIEAINNAKLFIYTSNTFDGWVNRLVNNENAFNTYENITIDSTDLSTIMHYWTDPLVFIQMIEVITERIISIDEDNKEIYLANKRAYEAEIRQTHNDLEAFLTTTTNKTIYFAGHNALGGLALRYNLEIIALIDDFKPDADHTIKDIKLLINALKKSNTNYLFIEELVEPKVANTIKRELEKKNLNITLKELHGYHNITKEQNKKGLTYAQIFKQNYQNLKKALN